MDQNGFPEACDFEQVEKREPVPVPPSLSICRHLASPFPDTDRCSVPPISTRQDTSPIVQGPIKGGGGGGGGGSGPTVLGGSAYTFVLPTTDLSAGGFAVSEGSGAGAFGADQRQTLPFDGWFPIDSIWGILVADTFTISTTLDTGLQQNAGTSGALLDIACSFAAPVTGKILSLTLRLQNVLSGATGLIAVDFYEGTIAGGAHPAGGPAPLPFLGSTAGVDAASIPDAKTDVLFSF